LWRVLEKSIVLGCVKEGGIEAIEIPDVGH
jgi:hypothetical protein